MLPNASTLVAITGPACFKLPLARIPCSRGSTTTKASVGVEEHRMRRSAERSIPSGNNFAAHSACPRVGAAAWAF